MGFLFHFFCCIIDIRFEKTQLFDFVILKMKFITVQFLGVAMLMMLYTFAAPLSEERQGGEENEMQREGTEMLRGTDLIRGGKPIEGKRLPLPHQDTDATLRITYKEEECFISLDHANEPQYVTKQTVTKKFRIYVY